MITTNEQNEYMSEEYLNKEQFTAIRNFANQFQEIEKLIDNSDQRYKGKP